PALAWPGAEMKLSVVIPTCDRPDALQACLQCLETNQQLRRTDFEIIVSDDSRKQLATEILHHAFPAVKWIEGPKRGPAANRNAGAKVANGEVIVFLDDDCLPQPG